MRMPSARSRFQPSRMRGALLLAVVCFALTNGVVGFAVANSGASPSPVPSVFSVPVPHVGDMVRIWVALENTTTGERSADKRYLEFTWLPDEVGFDEDGTKRLLNHVNITTYAHLVGNRVDDVRPFTTRARLDPESGRLVGSYGESRQTKYENGTSSTGLPYTRTQASVYASTTFVRPDDTYYFGAFCGIRNAFQGKAVALEGTVDAFGHCNPFTSARASDPALFAAVEAHQSLNGQVLILSAANAQNRSFSAWMSSTSPYPMELVSARAASPTALHIRFEVVTRGTLPITLREAPPAVPRPAPVGLAARTPWGLDDTGVVHDFPLSQAFQYAQNDPGYPDLRDFLRDHPGAVPVFAHYSEDVTTEAEPAKATDRTWFFQLADGFQKLCVLISRTDGLGARPLTAAAAPYSYGTCAFNEDDTFPAATKLPADWPSVAGMIRAWQALRGPEYGQEAANAWGFSVVCDNCSKPHLSFCAGRVQDQHTYGPTSTWTTRESKLAFWPDGDLQALQERYRDDRTGFLPGPRGGALAAPPKETVLFPQHHALAWSPPDAKGAAGIGLFSLMAAALYWLWPLLKAGPIGALYSRVVGPKVIGHPKRAELFQFIQENPGIHFLELSRRSGLGHGATEHHLAKLRESEMVTRAQNGEHHCYFVRGGVDRRVMESAGVVKAEGARLLLAAIRARPGLNGAEAARATGMTAPNVSYHLDRFRKSGLVEARRTGAGLRLKLTSLGDQVLSSA
ncbi:MAG: winged helix-turn-helix transcriptional regulator [Euryarchaeota archaeon]|nr:winged helix-turn-helix transcriptional regulator [Euryarchaeota archaeon]